jgi:hypothetical protein
VPTPDGGFLLTDLTKCVVSKVKGSTITPVAGDGGCSAHDYGPVSCPSTTFCAVAYGDNGFALTTNPTAATPSWTITKGVRTAGKKIEGMSCAGPSLCVIADQDGKLWTSTNPAGGASTWHSSQPTSARSSDLQEAVACPSTSLCILIGDSVDTILVSTNPTAGTPAGSSATWTPLTLTGGLFWGVNCRGTSICAVYGSVTMSGNANAGIAASTSPSASASDWHLSKLTGSGSSFYRANCATSTLCVGVGYSNTVASTQNPTDPTPTWTSGTVGSNFFYGVSCPSAALCAAVDSNGRVSVSSTPTNYASWTTLETADQAQTNLSGTTFCSLTAHCNITCPGTGLCLAGGNLGALRSTNPTGTAATDWSQAQPGDGGPATAMSLEGPGDAVPTSDGGFLLQEGGFPNVGTRSDVRKVASDGKMTRVAGTGAPGNAGDGGPAPRAKLRSTAVVPYNAPGQAVTVPGTGFLIANTSQCVIRKVDGGVITTVAGTPGVCTHAGDGGNATAANLYHPISAVPTPDGGFLVAEFGPILSGFESPGGSTIRKVGGDGKIHTVAGNNTAGYSGDGGSATSAQLNQPTSAVPTADGGFLIADWGNNVVRKVLNGTITTIAGSGQVGEKGDGGSAKSAQLIGPTAAVPTPDGGFLLGSFSTTNKDLAVRKVTASGVIGTVAGVNPNGKPPPPVKPKCSIKSAALKVVKKKPTIQVSFSCTQGVTAKVGGTITRTVKQKGKPTKTKMLAIKVLTISAPASKVVVVTLALPKDAVTGLKKGDKESAVLTLSAKNANGSANSVSATIKKLKLKK